MTETKRTDRVDLRYKYESKEAAKAARKQRHEWDKANYERRTVWLRKGTKEKIEVASEKAGKSRRAFIIDAIEKEIKAVMNEE